MGFYESKVSDTGVRGSSTNTAQKDSSAVGFRSRSEARADGDGTRSECGVTKRTSRRCPQRIKDVARTV